MYKYPLPLLSAFIALTANLGLSAGPVSLSFFAGLLLVGIVYVSFPQYAIIRKDMRLLMLFSTLSLLSLIFSPVSIDGTTIFTGLQIVYWFLLANIFSNMCKVVESKIFLQSILLTIFIIGMAFIVLSKKNDFFTENGASCIVVTIWPLGLFLVKNELKAIYILIIILILYLIGSRTGIILVLLQLICFFFVRKISAKKMVVSLATISIFVSLLSLPDIRLSIAEAVFPNDRGMQILIETPEVVFQMDKSWVQRRIQQEKSKQLTKSYPILGIGPLNFPRYNINIDTSGMSDVDDSILKVEFRDSDSRSSHNSYYQMMAENGIVGFIIVLFIMARIVVKLYNRRDESEGNVILLISAIGLFTNLFMVSLFWGTSTWMLLGIYSGYNRKIIVHRI